MENGQLVDVEEPQRLATPAPQQVLDEEEEIEEAPLSRDEKKVGTQAFVGGGSRPVWCAEFAVYHMLCLLSRTVSAVRD